MALSSAARRQGLIVLLVVTFFGWAGFFVVVPLIAVHYVDGLGWTAAAVGLVLAVRQFTQQGLTVVSGMLADRLGAKGLIAAGNLIRAGGFLMMAAAETFPLLLLACVVAGIGGGLFESPKAAAMAVMTDEQNRQRYYSIAGVMGGLGVVIGTQAGALLIRADFALVSIAGAVCYVLIFFIVLVFMPAVQVATGSHGMTGGLALALRDRTFVRYNAFLTGYWFIWTQFYVALPLVATSIAGSTTIVAWLYGVNSAVTIALGFPLPRFLDRRMAPLPALVLGIGVTAAGLGAIAFVSSTAGLLICVALFSLGSVIVRPAEQTVTAGLADPVARGSYFGVAAISLAIGGGLGNYLGGVVYDAAQSTGHPALPWVVFGGVGALTAAGLIWLGLSTPARIGPALAMRRAPAAPVLETARR